MKTNEIDLSDVKYIKDSVHTGTLMRSQLIENDVLMTITGRVEPVLWLQKKFCRQI